MGRHAAGDKREPSKPDHRKLLEQAATKLAEYSLKPWTDYRCPKHNRIRPVWLWKLHSLASKRSKVMRKQTVYRDETKKLDRDIRRELRRNCWKLRTTLADTCEGGDPSEVTAAVKTPFGMKQPRDIGPDE